MIFWAAVFLARDLAACRALLLGLEVPRHRLHPGALSVIDEPFAGAPVRLDDALALRCELAMASPTDRIWRQQRLRGGRAA